MKAYVFTDASLARYAGRFVWLSVDTENSINAAFLRKFPISVWPTLLVVEPKKEAIAMRYSGGATIKQLQKLLADGEKLVKGSTSPADEAIARADRLAGANKHAEAAEAYEEAIAKAPKGWTRLGRAAEALIFAYAQSGNEEKCAARALDLYPRVKGTYSAMNVAAVGLSCAKGPGETFDALEKAARETLDDPKMAMSGDDKSGLYETLIGARESVKDEEGAHKLREQRIALLEAEAAKAKTPAQRTVYDSHRLTEYLALEQPEKAIAMLEQSQRDFPKDYNPPARLALAYRAMGKYDEALAANSRALELVYGPRKITVYRARADIYTAKGDAAAARQTIEEAIRYAESLPEGQRSDRAIASLKKKLETM